MDLQVGQTVYLTAYALTKGVLRATIRSTGEITGGKGFATLNEFGFGQYYQLGKDIFLSESEALQIAEEMRSKRIESLEKQIDKLKIKKIKVKDAK